MNYRVALAAISLIALSACDLPEDDMPVPGTVIGQGSAVPAAPARKAPVKATSIKTTPSVSTSTKTAAAAPAPVSGRKKVEITAAPAYTGSSASPDEVIVDLYD